MKPTWPSAVVAVAVIALVAFMFDLAVDHGFATIWAGVGSIVGVVTGAIPSYFFQQQAQKSSAQVQAISAEATPEAVQAARLKNPALFV